MNNLYDTIIETNNEKEKQIKEQLELITSKLQDLTMENMLVLKFPVINELRSALYKKGYNVVVNGNESIISIRDPKEDIIDEWTTFDCGN